MRRILSALAIAGAFLLVTSSAKAQGVRVDPLPSSTVNGPLPGGAYPPLLVIPGTVVTLCGYPASGFPCTNFATSYTDATLNTACPAGKAVTWNGSASCGNTADFQGKFGFWVAAGNYTYTLQNPNSGQIFGPYAFSAGGSGSATGAVLLIPPGSQTIERDFNGLNFLAIANSNTGTSAGTGYAFVNDVGEAAIALGSNEVPGGASDFTFDNFISGAPMTFQTNGGNQVFKTSPSTAALTLDSSNNTTVGGNLTIDGTCTGCGGGGSLPSASLGQMLTNNNGTTGYAGQANIFYQQSGDTIASIETACSSACTYVVTSPQTITLAANHTLSANIWLQFEADGSWTVNGSGFTLSGIQVNGGSTTSQHFIAGTGSVALGAYNTDVPVEWFGAVVGATLPAADSTTAIQTCFNSIFHGQCSGQSGIYKTTAALTINRPGIGFHGTKAGYWQTTIENTSASADTIDVTGGVYGNDFNNFQLARSVAPTGTAAGLSLNAGGYNIDTVSSVDSIRNFYYHKGYSYGVGVTQNSSAGYSLSESSGPLYAFYLDSADGNAENSIRFLNDGASAGSATATTYGMILTGEAVNDVMTYGFETAGMSYGQVVNYTGSGGTFATNDIHFTKSIHDGIGISCYKVTGTTLATDGFVEIAGGHCNSSTSSSALADIESSYGVAIRGVNFNQHTGFSASHAIFASGDDHLIVSNNTITNFGTSTTSQSPIEITGTTHYSLTGNTIHANTGNAGNIIWITGNSTYGSVVSNTLDGFSTAGNGIGIDAGSNFNNCCSANAIDTTHIATATVSDSGTGNGFIGPMNFYNSASGTANPVANFFAPNTTAGAGSVVYGQFGVSGTGGWNSMATVFGYTASASANNWFGYEFANESTYNQRMYGNYSTEFGETTPAAGPANGIAVGTTGQFQVSGAGAVTAPSLNGLTTPTASGASVVSQKVQSGTAPMGTSAIASGACATVVTVAATGIVTTDVIQVGFNGDPTAVTGYVPGAQLTIIPYPTAGNVNFKACNNTASSITPSALTINWRVDR